jgi:C-terminal processing protease CtpA/Prc
MHSAFGDGDQMRRSNYQFKKVEILPGNIGYVRLDGFLEGSEAEKAAAAAMNFVARCDAVIFDLRQNGGGSPEMIRFITSYLFDRRTHLNDMVDRDGKVVEEYWTLDSVPGDRLAADAPVYVLTSKRTFSGAEEFSYNLKHLKRGTIVGETTGGGAHPVRMERITDRVAIGVPFMRACNPISKTNWEGTGVAPDIAVPADKALDEAVAAATTTLRDKRASTD